MSPRAKPTGPDYRLLTLTLVLVCLGIMLVFDASFPRAGDHGDAWKFLKRQSLFALVGLGAGYLAMRCRPAWFRKWTWPALAICMVSLVAVKLVGHSIGGASRSFDVGFIHIQPSEFAKIAAVLLMADTLQRTGTRVRRLPSLWLPLSVVGLLAGLVLIEPDLGTASTIVLTTAAMLYAAGARRRELLSVGAYGMLAAGLVTCIDSYKLERIYVWLNPWAKPQGSGFQITHALTALGSGGLLGRGLCEGIEKSYIPAPETDMIGATLGEEAGLIGMVVLLGLFVLFTHLGVSIAQRAKSRYASLLVTGITAMIGVQAFINIAVFTGLVPMTGIPLPFISYGGSHLVAMMFAVGMILSVSRNLDDRMGEPEPSTNESSSNRGRHGRPHIPRPFDSRRSGPSGRRNPVRG